MADFVSEIVTKENIDEFKESLISGGLSWEAARKITIADDVPFTDVLPSRIMKKDEQDALSRILINTVYHNMDSHQDEISSLLKQGKKTEACQICRMEELANLDQKNPILVARIIGTLGNSRGGFYSELLDIIDRRSPERNFVLAQHIRLDYQFGKETNITELSREDANSLRALWEQYDRYRTANSYNRSDEDVNGYTFIKNMLKRGDLLNCKHLTEKQRNLAIDSYYNDNHRGKNLLDKIDESNITAHLIEKIVEHPSSYLDLYCSEPLNTPRFQKVEKATFRILEQMPKYDSARYGYEKGLNERFEELLTSTRNSTYEKLDERGQDPFVSAIYLRTAQQDILEGHADKLSPYALAFVLKYDKQGVFARKIQPEILEKAQKNAKEQDKQWMFNNLHDEQFIINREKPVDIYDLRSTVQSQAFKKLTFKEREDKIKISEFAEKLKLLHLPLHEAQRAVSAMQMVLRGEGEKTYSSDQKASEIVENIETAYQKRKESYKLRVENTEKAEAVGRSCEQKASRDKTSYEMISSLQAVYSQITGSAKKNPPEKKEAHLAQSEVEKLISSSLEGKAVQLSVPDFGGLPLFGRANEEERRRKMRQDIDAFNTALKTIQNSSSLKEDLKEYNTKLLEPKTKEQAAQKAGASQKTLAEVSLKIKAYNEEFLYKDDTKNMIVSILQYAQEPLERRKSNSLSDIYDFLEADARFEKNVAEARLENESYVQALKQVAKERVGVSDEKVPVVEGGHGKETHDQREELKKVSDRLDKLSKRQAGGNTDQTTVKRTKEQVRNAQQRLKLVKNNGNEL